MPETVLRSTLAAEPPRPAGAAGQPRLYGLDWLRALAIVAVVGLHTLDNQALGGLRRHLAFAVPCFVMMALYLGYPKLAATGRWTYLTGRLRRLGTAYLVWSTLYLVLRATLGHLRVTPGTLIGVYLFGGAAMPLYFVPLLLVLTAVAAALLVVPRAGVLVCALGVPLSFLLDSLNLPASNLGTPEASAFPTYLRFELPFLFAGLLIAYAGHRFLSARANERPPSDWPAITLMAAAVLIKAVTWPAAPLQSLGFRLATCMLFVGFLLLSRPFPGWLISLPRYAFGIFLIHPVFVESCSRFDETATLPPVARFIAVLALSWASCAAIGRVAPLRVLVR